MKVSQQNKEIQKKVQTLISQMTLEEKLAQIQAFWIFDLQTNGKMDFSKVKSKLTHGIGQITRTAGANNILPEETARTNNAIQKFLKEHTRLGIPAIVHEECCSGLMAPGSTIFPQMIGLASTFQPELAGEMTSAIKLQMRATGAHQGLAPVLDVARDPRWGRVEETFGEDPTLVSQFGVSYIRGLQGENLSQGVSATGKHFVGHSYSLGGLNCGPVLLGWHEIWDVYLAPFQAAIRDAGLATMMNAYPELDGEVVAASRKILTDLLREKLGFNGLVVSDYEAVMMIHNYHHAAETKKDAAIKALTAGIDVELPSVTCYGDDLMEAVRKGEIGIETIDLSVSRHLQKKFELGLFENPYVDEGNVLNVFETPDNRSLALKIANKSMVLLKNDGILPLNKSIQKIAVIGPNANSTRTLMGDYTFVACAELNVQLAPRDSVYEQLTRQDFATPTVKMVSILDGIKETVSPTTVVQFASGCDPDMKDESGFSDALKIARESDVVIFVLGDLSGLAYYCTTGEFRDRTDLRLPGVQEKLFQHVIQANKPVVLVLNNGRPASIPDLIEKSNAVLEAWIPGEEGGNAVAQVLFGDMNPGGKLPLSIPRSVGQLPVFYNHKPSGRHSNIYGNYVNEEVTPLFAFGHGLSYTTFAYTDLTINPTTANSGKVVDVSLKVKNTGKRSGEEVVQLYIRDEYASYPRPVKELKGFVRLLLSAGETKTVIFHLSTDQLAYYDHDLRLVLEPGKFQVMVGSSSDDIRLEGEFTIGGDLVEIKERVFVCPVEIQ